MGEPIELHRMGPVEIASTTFRVYLRTLPTMLGLGVLFLGIGFAVILVMGIAVGIGGSVFGVDSVFGAVGLALGGGIVGLVIIMYYYAAVTLTVSVYLTGHKAGLLQVLKRISGTLIFQLLGTLVLVALAIIGGFILLIIPGIIFAIRFLFASPIVVLERVTYARAMRRSRELVKDHWWRIFLSLLVVTVLIQVASFIIVAILSIALLALGLGESSSSIAQGISSVVLYPLGLIYPVLLYYDIRIRKEAFNIAALREAL